MSQEKTLAKNTILIGLAKASAALVSFLLLPLMTALINPNDYGVLDLVISYAGLILPLVTFSLDSGVFRFLISARDDNDKKTIIISTALKTILPVITLCSILFLIISHFAHLSLAPYILLYMISNALSGFAQFISRGLGKNVLFTVSSLIQSVLSVIGAIIALTAFNSGIEGVFVAYSIALLISVLVIAVPLKIHRHISFKTFNKNTQKELLRYSLPLIPNSISGWVFSVSDRTVLSIVLGATANGIYAISNKFSGIFNTFLTILYTSWIESSSANIDKPNKNKFFSNVFNTELKLVCAFSLLLISVIPIVFNWLVSEQFSEGYLYIPILIGAGIFNFLVIFYSSIYVALKKTKQVMYTSVVAAAINLVTNLCLVWFIGIWAAAISTIVAYAVMATYRHYDVRKYIKLSIEKNIFIKIALVFTLACIPYYINITWLNITNLAFCIIISIIINRDLLKKGKRHLSEFLHKSD